MRSPDAGERAAVADRSIVVRRLKALPMEAVVRGYLIGSGWKGLSGDWRSLWHLTSCRSAAGTATTPSLSSHPQRRPNVARTMRTSASKGLQKLWVHQQRQRRADAAMALYKFASEHALKRGIIIADTKFEFGLDAHGTLTAHR